MGSILSKKQAPSRVTEQDEAVLQLKTQRDKIKQYKKRVEKNLDHERETAKKLIAEGKKDRALLLLKKKRYQEKMIDQALQQLSNIEQMIYDVEYAQIQAQVVDSLSKGNEALKKINRLMSLEDVERIMEETRESADYQQEINSIIGSALSQGDIDEVEAELDQLLAEENQGVQLPEVPTEPLPQAEKAREKASSPKRRKEVEMLPA